MATQEQIDNFHSFASRHVSGDESSLTVAELFDLWQIQNIDADELVQSVQSVKSAIADMEAGDSGKPFNQFTAEMRNEFGIAKIQ